MRSKNQGFGAYVGVIARWLAVLLTLHTKRQWAGLGQIDRGVVTLIWIALIAPVRRVDRRSGDLRRRDVRGERRLRSTDTLLNRRRGPPPAL